MTEIQLQAMDAAPLALLKQDTIAQVPHLLVLYNAEMDWSTQAKVAMTGTWLAGTGAIPSAKLNPDTSAWELPLFASQPAETARSEGERTAMMATEMMGMAAAQLVTRRGDITARGLLLIAMRRFIQDTHGETRFITCILGFISY